MLNVLYDEALNKLFDDFSKLSLKKANNIFSKLTFCSESKFSFIKSLNIINIGIVSNPYLINFYKKCNCLIFPSKYESFGLPLLEARSLKLPIIAPELDYVREVCCPMETFDPSSSVSLANSVRRFMGINQSPLYIRKPIDFINFLIGDIDSLT